MEEEQEGERPVRDLQEDLHDFRGLEQHRGWIKFLQLQDEIKILRMRDLVQPLTTGVDGALYQEYQKGVIAGVQLSQESVANFCADLEKQIAERTEKTKEIDDGQRDGSSDELADTELAP